MYDPRVSRRRTKWLVGLLVAAAAVGSLIALAPTILSQGLAARWLAGMIQKRVEGSVTIEQLHLSWADGQRVKGLKINDTLGHEVADLDLRLASGLAALLLSPAREQQVDVTGRLLVDINDEGSWSLLRPAQHTSPVDRAVVVPALPLQLHLSGLDLHVRDASRRRDMRFDDLQGSARAGRARPLKADLSAAVKGLMGSGTLQLTASVEDLVDELGRLQPGKAKGELMLTGQSIAWSFEGEEAPISELRVDASSDKLSEKLNVTLATSGAIDDQPCRLNGTLLVIQPVKDGAIAIDLSGITGQLHGQRLPLILLEPWLGQTTLDLIHAFGDGFDVDADLVGETDRRLTITAHNDRTALNLDATITQEGIDGHQARLEWSVPPALTASLGGTIKTQSLTAVSNWRSFSVPWPAGRGPQLEGVTGTGTVELSGSLASGEDSSSAIGKVVLELDSTAFRDGLRYRGTMTVDDGTLTIDEGRIALIDDNGAPCFRAGEASAQLDVTPDLWKRLGAGAIGIVLTQDASATIALQPFSVERAKGGAWSFKSLAFTAAVKGAEFGDAQELTRVVGLPDLSLQGAIDLESQAALQVSGNSTVVFASAPETPGRCHFELRGTRPQRHPRWNGAFGTSGRRRHRIALRPVTGHVGALAWRERQPDDHLAPPPGRRVARGGHDRSPDHAPPGAQGRRSPRVSQRRVLAHHHARHHQRTPLDRGGDFARAARRGGVRARGHRSIRDSDERTDGRCPRRARHRRQHDRSDPSSRPGRDGA